MTDKLPTVVREGSFELSGVTLRTYVLDDGRRIIDADDLASFFVRWADAPTDDDADISPLIAWLGGASP